MKIIALQAENIKKIIAVEIRPNGNIVEITGKNGQGKTSVLDSIWWALGGAKDIQKIPIRNGTESGFVKLDLGEMIVTRTFKKDNSGEATTRLTVENKEGVKFTSPQAMLDKLLGDLTFEPLLFARADSGAQFDQLRKFVPEVDFKAIDAANKSDYENRTVLNRQAKERRAAAEQIVTNLDGTEKHVNTAGLINQMAEASKKNSDIEVRKSNRRNLELKVNDLRERAAELNKEADQIWSKLESAEELPELTDISALQKEIATAEKINTQLDQAGNKKNLIDTAEQLEADSEKLTQSIKKREGDKNSKIEAAQLPVEGLSFGNNEVLLNGVPFNQASDAQQLRASIAIAMALNPKIRIVRVRDGSLLDENSMKLLAEMAEKNDFQIWIERVDGSGKVGFFLEEGQIKNSAAPEEEPIIDG